MREMRAGDCSLPRCLTSKVSHTATGLPRGEQREGSFSQVPSRQSHRVILVACLCKGLAPRCFLRTAPPSQVSDKSTARPLHLPYLNVPHEIHPENGLWDSAVHIFGNVQITAPCQGERTWDIWHAVALCFPKGWLVVA